MNHFFVKPHQIGDDTIRIQGMDVDHIRKVLRMKKGEELLLSDGEGHDYTCAIQEIAESEICCRILKSEASGTEPSVKVWLFQGLPKADKFEHIIQKSVELGVYRIVPVKTSRSIVKYDAKKAEARKQRWQKISESAAKQSRRGIIPVVEPVSTFQEALKMAESLDMVLIPYENYKDIHKTRELLAKIKPGMQIGIFVGPEGGFEQEEVERASAEKEQGGAAAYPISLGARILRTETAPLMLLSVLLFQMEGINS